jgi:hypothetical protein
MGLVLHDMGLDFNPSPSQFRIVCICSPNYKLLAHPGGKVYSLLARV